jgi:flagella basal body P-ring formation protein FlgA
MKCLELLERLNRKFLVLLFFFFVTGNSFAFIEIDLKKFTKVKEDTVYLKNIADIKAENEEPSFINFLKNLPITKSPSPLENISISKEQLIYLFQRNHISVDSFRFGGADTCIITRDYKELSPQKIEKKVSEFIRKNFENTKLVSINLPNKSYFIPTGNIKEKVSLKSESLRHVYLDYLIYQNGKILYKIPITANIKKYMKVIEAKKDIPKGKILTTEDLKTAEIEFKRRSGYITEIENVVGKVAKRDIKKGTVIRNSLLKPNYKVRKRKKVKIVYRNRNINIELMGLALEDGAVGDIIKVKNISSGKVILCKVVKENTVIYSGSSF